MMDPVTRMYNPETFRRISGKTKEEDEREEQHFIQTVARVDPVLADELRLAFAGQRPVPVDVKSRLNKATKDLVILDAKRRLPWIGLMLGLMVVVVFGAYC